MTEKLILVSLHQLHMIRYITDITDSVSYTHLDVYKRQEYRSAKISNDTFEFLMDYLAKYRKILQHQDYLFVNIMGENIGKPLRVDSVYDMLDRMEKKTGVKITPHMLRHLSLIHI